jgi:hypothetical protein
VIAKKPALGVRLTRRSYRCSIGSSSGVFLPSLFCCLLAIDFKRMVDTSLNLRCERN